MTPEQKRDIAILRRCSFYSGSRDKSWVMTLAANLDERPEIILPAFWAIKLQKLLHRYRRQHGRCTCLICFQEASKNDMPYQERLFEEGK